MCFETPLFCYRVFWGLFKALTQSQLNTANKEFQQWQRQCFFLQSLKRIDIKSVVSLKRQSHDWSLLFDTLWKFLPPSFSFLIWKSLTSCTFRKNCHTNPLVKISNFIFAIFFHYYTMAVGCPLHGNSI